MKTAKVVCRSLTTRTSYGIAESMVLDVALVDADPNPFLNKLVEHWHGDKPVYISLEKPRKKKKKQNPKRDYVIGPATGFPARAYMQAALPKTHHVPAGKAESEPVKSPLGMHVLSTFGIPKTIVDQLIQRDMELAITRQCDMAGIDMHADLTPVEAMHKVVANSWADLYKMVGSALAKANPDLGPEILKNKGGLIFRKDQPVTFFVDSAIGQDSTGIVGKFGNDVRVAIVDEVEQAKMEREGRIINMAIESGLAILDMTDFGVYGPWGPDKNLRAEFLAFAEALKASGLLDEPVDPDFREVGEPVINGIDAIKAAEKEFNSVNWVDGAGEPITNWREKQLIQMAFMRAKGVKV